MMGDFATGHSAKAQLAKAQLRALIRAERARLGPEQSAEADARRMARLLARLDASPHTVIACYVSTGSEPDTTALLADLVDTGMRLLLPVADSASEPEWTWWSGEPMVRGRLGISQPTSPSLGPDALHLADVIILPGLAATTHGARLGQGGGWYDRALCHAREEVPRWLLLNDSEVLETVPTDPWDLLVTTVITERRWIECSSEE